MFLPKPLRKFVAVFRGDVSPLLITLSVALGFWFGLTPGWTGIHIALLLVILVVNANLGIFAMFAGVGRGLAWAAAPLLFHAGVWAQAAFAGLFSVLGSLPLLGLTDFAVYAVAGATILGPLLGLGVGLLIAYLVSLFRRTWLKFEEKSDKLRAWQEKAWVRWLDWLLVGKRAKDAKSALGGKVRLVRIPGVITAAVVLVLAAGAVFLSSGDQLATIAEAQLTQANGAEVNIAGFDLQPLNGRLALGELQVTNPDQPEENRLAARDLTADVGLLPLLRGKVVLDEIVIGTLAFDQPRAKPGKVVRPTESDGETPAEESAEPPAEQLDLTEGEQLAKLEDYLRKADELKRRLAQAAEWLPEPGEPAPPPPQPAAYPEYLRLRSPQPASPRVQVRKLTLKDVATGWEQFGTSEITFENLSDAPRAALQPVVIHIKSQERPAELRVTAHYERAAGGATLKGTLKGVELAELQREQLSDGNPVRLTGGTADVDISGTAAPDALDLQLAVQTQNLQTEPTSGLYGLDPQVTQEALKVLENLQTTVRVVGSPQAPRLVLETGDLKEQLTSAAVDAGKREVTRQLDKVVGEQLGDDAPKTEEVTKDPVGAGKQALEGLLGGNKDKDDK